MATRRQLPSRTRSNNTLSAMPPPSSNRPRSGLAKSNSSQHSQATATDDAPEAGPSTVPASSPALPLSPKRRAAKPTADDDEINIKVVLRCRRRSEREIQDSSPIIVSSNGARSQEVTIETATPVSSFGLVTLPPTRTYPFDVVFGPEADQALIYQDVVAPMLEEVLLGYNFTLFAYGQTGTGKTHTMQGDLIPTPLGNPSAQAGMIPRVLARLFSQLEASGNDYAVKVSFVELYNEELRDLLAPELAAPAGSTQPMGMGKDTKPNELKIFDDASKKGGVFIQGLEEVSVKDAAHALSILTKGSQRRQIAATRFNDHSSRSHSVFALTVHTKETSTMGDDLLRVGKMNLVDLAGSENIGRSGAENKRAREAGMINQSLLTLGRVINALVDKSSHVPYRESKLTRLLQDSLGGRTKTCIIATISPARSNMEETLSTLDYAMRAKSIRNRPEVNQRMTRNALMKEYVGEIERLRADLLAAREKTGIYFSDERWSAMTAEQELARTEVEEARKQIEIVESQLRNVREEFEQSIEVLARRDGELRDTKGRLRETQEELGVREGQLKKVEGALEEEIVVRSAFQETEGVLDGVAGGLKKVTTESLQDLGGLFDKLDRKTTVFTSNSKSVYTHSKTLAREVKTLAPELDDFVKTSAQHAAKLRAEAEQFQKRELESLSGLAERVGEQARKLQETLQVVQAKEQAADEAVRAIQAVVDETYLGIKNGFAAWADGLQKSCATMCGDMQASGASSHASAEKALKSVVASFEAVTREAHEFVESERTLATDARALADEATATELARLRAQNAQLSRLLDAEAARAERARGELVARVAGLLGEFTAERDRSLREALGEVEQGNLLGQGAVAQFGERHAKMMDEGLARSRQWGTALEKRGAEGKRTRDGALKVLHTSGATMKDGLENVHSHLAGSVSTYSTDLQGQAQTLQTNCAGAYERISRAKRARVEATNQMASETQSTFRHLQQGIASTSRDIGTTVGKLVAENATLAKGFDKYQTGASSHLATMRQATQSLVENGTREDVPTGTTPRKRMWEYTDQWELTKSRDVLLREWRQRGISRATSETFLAEHMPLPEEAIEEEAGNMDAEMDAEAGSAHEEDSTGGDGDGDAMEEEETTPVPAEPRPTHSRSASVTSTMSAIPQAMPAGKKAGAPTKSAQPPMGTLTERSANILVTRRRYR